MTGGFDLLAYLEKWRRAVDGVLGEILSSGPSAYASGMYEAMRYSVFAGGKRVRPILCVAGCEAVGGEPEAVLKTAAAIEMIHTYSLIHDDLPAMDNDDLRRGKPSNHKKFGEANAILAGDGLLTEAFGVIAEDTGLSPALRTDLVSEVVKASGVRGMVAGQVVDMEKEGTSFTEEDVDFIHEHKTAAIISVSCVAGVMIGGGDKNEIEAVREYARALGLVFQIVDDVLNVTGGKDLGKGVGTDAARGKAAYPALFGVDRAREKAKELYCRALEAICGFDERALPLRAIAQYVVERNN